MIVVIIYILEKKENILNLRLFGIYGDGEDSSRVTSCIVNARIKNEPVILNQNVRFHFIWIDDFCKIVKHFVEHPTRETLKGLIQTKTFLDIGKMYGVSDNAVRKWCKNENLPYRSRDIKLIKNWDEI